MYGVFTANSKTENILQSYIRQRGDIKNKLDRLKLNPRRECGAHPLHGRLAGKWSCWLGGNIRAIYIIDDERQLIIIEAVGTHKIY